MPILRTNTAPEGVLSREMPILGKEAAPEGGAVGKIVILAENSFW